MEQPVICTLSPSPARRVIALTVTSGIALMLLWLAATAPPQHPGWLVAQLGGGAGLLWLTVKVWHATEGRQILLTRAGLTDSDGTCIAAMDDIAAVDRSVFAFKPSGGFVLRLTRAPGRGWAPGMWWRMGRQLGVGGITPNAQGRAMADMIGLVLADRAGALDALRDAHHDDDGPQR